VRYCINCATETGHKKGRPQDMVETGSTAPSQGIALLSLFRTRSISHLLPAERPALGTLKYRTKTCANCRNRLYSACL